MAVETKVNTYINYINGQWVASSSGNIGGEKPRRNFSQLLKLFL